jgi:hypothetical protein
MTSQLRFLSHIAAAETLLDIVKSENRFPSSQEFGEVCYVFSLDPDDDAPDVRDRFLPLVEQEYPEIEITEEW